MVESHESVSTWRPAPVPPPTASRRAVIDQVADLVVSVRPGRVRVCIDGFTAAGKTTFSVELAEAVRRRGRSTLRASLDDFKHPWRHAIDHGYDRISGEGYYRNAPDFESARDLLLAPAGVAGSGGVVLCAHDPLTGEDHRGVVAQADADAVLVVDSVFAMRPEYDEYWDLRIWLDVPPDLSLARGVARDTEMEGSAEAAEALHRDRYHAAEQIYVAEVDPVTRADVVIDNSDVLAPIILRGGSVADP